WSALGTTVSPAAAGLGALLTSVGILVPLAGPRLAEWLRSWRTYTRLEPLERELDDLLTRCALRLPRPRWSSPTTRLVWRQTSIHNALSYLDASFDPALYERTRGAALEATGDKEHAEAAAWAAVITSAVRGPWEPGRRPAPHGHPEGRPGDRVPGPAVLVRIAAELETAGAPSGHVRGGTTPSGAV
ncbi:DUF6545 domain-containing protein, partial [Streptomyces carpinensis]